MNSSDYSEFIHKVIDRLNKCEHINSGNKYSHSTYRFNDFQREGINLIKNYGVYCEKCELIFAGYQNEYMILQLSGEFKQRIETLEKSHGKLIREVNRLSKLNPSDVGTK